MPLKDKLSSIPESAFMHFMRTKEKESKESSLDYTILRVVVMTLSLVLLLQLLRHKLDSIARRMPLFKSVLEGVYEELSLLGIIELAIYIMSKFDVSLQKNAYYAFADVHFALFFTPLFNAFQSCVIAFFISRNSRKSWVIAENQDTAHYEEIHEEYNFAKIDISRSVDSIKQYFIGEFDSHGNPQTSPSDSAERGHVDTATNVASIWDVFIHLVQLPCLHRKCKSLRLQIRFHELRKYFIQANELPLTFPLSDYLKRCEMHVLHELVHISMFKWMILAGAVDLLYFLFGVHTYISDGKGVNLSYVMSLFFFVSIFLFILISLVMWNKINNIFHTTISNMFNPHKSKGENEGTGDFHSLRSEGEGKSKQLSLFWGGNTKHIIHLIQFMQFGFALAFSTLLIYWFDMHPKENKHNIPKVYYLIFVTFCFLCFVAIMSHVIPCFTICSNFGYLVDKKRLDQTLARHHLEMLVQEHQDHNQNIEENETVHHQLGPITLSHENDNEPQLSKPTKSSLLYSFFSSREYLNFSALGTMICFSLVAMRLEAFMIEMGPIYGVSDDWHFKSSICFWLEISCLCCFLFGDFLALLTFRDKSSSVGKDRCYFWAAVIDIIICFSCLLLLFISQQKRCCNQIENRFLLDSTKYDIVECCPPFGNRLYGGFGALEMLTSIIVLRFFRFWAVRKILNILNAGAEKSQEESHDLKLKKNGNSLHSFDSSHEGDHHDSAHGTQNLHEETGTIIDFWRTAVSKHPDIVEKYGEFSGSLLKAMLGIPIVNDTKEYDKTTASDHLRSKSSSAAFIEAYGFKGMESESYSANEALYSTQKPSFPCLKNPLLSKKYILEDIEMSRDWESTEDLDFNQDMTSELGTTLSQVNYSMKGKTNDKEMNSRLTSSIAYEECIDDAIKVSDFVSPHERLVQSMRRCDRKALPFLDRWVTVDVVLTNNEIVYFDAADSNKLKEDNSDIERRMKEVHQNLVSTQGGQGLRLGDVAFGRKIIGREELAKIQEIHVHRIMLNADIPRESEASSMTRTGEYWEDPVVTANNKGDSHIMETCQRIKERQIKEDQLILKTVHGILFLRFHGDFGNCDKTRDTIMKEAKAGEPIHMNNALQWCQSIGRLVGTERLKQDLPHFGDNTSNEIRDYLTLVTHHNKLEGQWHRLKNLVSSQHHSYNRGFAHNKDGFFS